MTYKFFLKKEKILLFLSVFLLTPVLVFSQIGFKLSLNNPTGDMGRFFKKAPSYELYYVTGNFKTRFRAKAGINYTNFKPRLDTFPTWGYRGGNDPAFFAGSQVYHKFYMALIFVNIDLKVLHRGNFYWYVGTSLTGGIAHVDYDLDIPTVINEHGNTDQEIVGFVVKTNAEYKLNDHFSAFLELSKSSLSSTDWSSKYGHYNYGIGLNYQIQ